MTKNVHTEHCCEYHGCKYCEPDCPVENGIQEQSYSCEFCNDIDISFTRDEIKVMFGLICFAHSEGILRPSEDDIVDSIESKLQKELK